MKREYSPEEDEEWLHAVQFELDSEKLSAEQKSVKTGLGIIQMLLQQQAHSLDDEFRRLLELKPVSQEQAERLQRVFYERAQIQDAFDLMLALQWGAKHPVQRLVDVARKKYGGNRVPYKQQIIRCLITAFVEAYAVAFKASASKAARVAAECINSLGIDVSADALRSYVAKAQEDPTVIQIYFLPQWRALFRRYAAEDLFIHFRQYAATLYGGDAPFRFVSQMELMKRPPSSHQE
jgi:hypothetical protein